MSEQFSFITAALRGRRRTDKKEEVELAANGANELLVAQGLPPYTEMAARYDTWQIQTSTLLAPLNAVPTTTAALEIWCNISSDDTFIVESLFADQILGTAAAQAYAIYACVSAAKAVPSLTALTVTNVMGDSGSYTSAVGSPLVTGVGTTVVANGWRPYGVSPGSALQAATPMHSWEAPINGRLLVRPGRSLFLHIVGSLTTASSFQVGAQGYMVPNSVVKRK